MTHEERTHYEVLGVAEDAEVAEIKRAWREIAKRCHPDRTEEAWALSFFKEANASWMVLSDPGKRREYDEKLARTRKPVCSSCGQTALPGTTMCYFCALRVYQEEQGRLRAAARAEAERRKARREAERRQRQRAAEEAARRAEELRVQRERANYEWTGDLDTFEPPQAPESYAYEGMDPDEIVSVLMSNAAITSATRAAQRSGIKSVSVKMAARDGSKVEVVVDRDMANYMREVSDGLRSAQRVIGLVGKWWKGSDSGD